MAGCVRYPYNEGQLRRVRLVTEPNATRVGTGKQAAVYARAPHLAEHDRTSVEEQVAACRALADELGYTVAEDAVLSDVGPASTPSRPGVTALLGLVAARRVDAVVVYTVDRLARQESKPLELLLKGLRVRGIPLYIARTPRGYRYDPATGMLVDDPEAVSAANQEEWRPPEYLPIPRKYDLGV